MFRTTATAHHDESPARPLILATVLGLLAFVGLAGLMPGVARAGLTWCAGDPGLAIEGHQVNVTVFVPEENLAQVDGDVVVEITVPRNVDVRVLFVDSTYFRERVVIMHTSERWDDDEDMEAGVRAYVPAKGRAFPVAMTIDAPTAAEGEQFQWIDGTSRSWMAGSVTLPFDDD